MIDDQIWLLSLALSIMEYQIHYKSYLFITIMAITIHYSKCIQIMIFEGKWWYQCYTIWLLYIMY